MSIELKIKDDIVIIKCSCGECDSFKIKKCISINSEIYIWKGIKDRCLNAKNKEYKNYGGRGIKICDEWKNSFENFIKDMGKRPNKNYSIDRIDNNKGYFKENCRWATSKEQANNRRTCKFISYKGKKQSLMKWCEDLNLNYYTIKSRINCYNWDIKKAFMTKTNTGFKKIR